MDTLSTKNSSFFRQHKLVASITLGLTFGVMSALTLSGCGQEQTKSVDEPGNSATTSDSKAIWPTLDIAVKRDDNVEARVESILATMTLEQKVAQMIQPEIRDITVEDMRKYGFGSYLNGGGSFPNGNKQSTAQDWIDLAEAMYQASVDDSVDGSTIPTMWGTDAVHGHNNVIGATLFPHNIGLGAANNPALIEKIAEVTAKEVMVTGIDWVFAPTVAVVRDDRWGRTYEGYSEDPEIVRSYSAAIVKGLQGHADGDFLSEQRVISTVKHFLGDGGTIGGDDQGDNIASEQELFDIHAQGYVGGLTAGAQSVMASFNSWHGKKIHGDKYLLTDVLKDKMGFDGFVVGDWNGHGQIKGCSNDNCAQAANAGLDIYMVPTGAWKPLYENTIAQVKSGEISQSRIDDAVRRILRVKLRAGLYEKPSPAKRPYSGKTELIGSEPHREVARQAVRESLVLLKNKENVLPLSPKLNVLVAGDGADNIGKQSGGWTITWQGTGNDNKDFPGGTSVYDGIEAQVAQAGGKAVLSVDGSFDKKPDVAVVVFGEEPYAEGHGDRENLAYQQGDKSDLALLKSLKAQGIPVISLFISGRPMWVNSELNASDAFVAAWLPGSEGGAIADVLFTDKDGNVQHDFKGKLSFSWPNSPYQATVNRGDSDYQPLLPYGFGLRYGEENTLNDALSEEVVFDESTVKQRDLFVAGKLHKPWLMELFSGEQNMLTNANTHQIGALSYRTIDKKVQEDAVLISSKGGEVAGLRIESKSHFREDIFAVTQSESALVFSMKLATPLTGSLIISTECDIAEGVEDDCGGKVDISKLLGGMAIDTWQTVSIDLACFTQQGMDYSNTVMPFVVSSSDAYSLGIADVSIVPNIASQAIIQCE